MLPKPPTQAEIARRMHIRQEALSRGLRKGLDSEAIELLTAALLELCRAQKLDADPDAFRRCEEIEAILDDGIEAAARAIEQSLTAARADRADARSASEREVRERIRLAWSRSPAREASDVTAAEMFRLGREVWPGMTPPQLGFVYQEVGDLVRRDAEDGPSLLRAARLYQGAEAHHAAALVKSIFNRAKSHMKAYRATTIPADQQAEAARLATALFRDANLLGSLYELPPLLSADMAKARAEFESLVDAGPGKSPALVSPSSVERFEEAASAYERALNRVDSMDEDEKGSPAARHATLNHNAGYCWMRAGSPRARARFEEAGRAYLGLRRPEWVAYNLKFLALVFDLAGETVAGVWCSRASVLAYDATQVPRNSRDYRDGVRVRDRLGAKAGHLRIDEPPAAQIDEEATAYSARVLAAYEARFRQIGLDRVR